MHAYTPYSLLRFSILFSIDASAVFESHYVFHQKYAE